MCRARVVQVHVGSGSNRQSFGIHAPLLYLRSKYFQALVDGDWLETVNDNITLKDDDPAVFDMFANWLYFQELAPGVEISRISTHMILDLALYADFREIPGLHNVAIDALAKRCLQITSSWKTSAMYGTRQRLAHFFANSWST